MVNIYLAISADDELLLPSKIGYTSRSPQTRLNKEIQVGCPYELKIYCSMVGVTRRENELHCHYIGKHARGEWYNLDVDDMNEIQLAMELAESQDKETRYSMGYWINQARKLIQNDLLK